jgi:hypothetical protein
MPRQRAPRYSDVSAAPESFLPPPIGEESPVAVTDQAAPPSPPLAAAPATISLTDLPLGDVPMAEVRGGRYYLSRHIDVPLQTVGQCVAVRRLFLGLDASGARLENGRRTTSHADAIRWLLEKVEQASRRLAGSER